MDESYWWFSPCTLVFSHGQTHTVPGAFDTEVTVGLCVFICVPVMGCWHSLQLKLD